VVAVVRVVRLLKVARVVRVVAVWVVQAQVVIQEQVLQILAVVAVEFGTQQQVPTAVQA
jgi:hypothetical protein